jgi:hypothetical protein
VVERHFTDSNNREGPDHKFAMNPENWARMVEETRLLERALGSADKFIAENEVQTAIVQRRCLRAAREIKAGEIFTRDMIDVLRPAAAGAIKPSQIEAVVGTRALADIPFGKELRWTTWEISTSHMSRILFLPRLICSSPLPLHYLAVIPFFFLQLGAEWQKDDRPLPTGMSRWLRRANTRSLARWSTLLASRNG